MIHGNVPLSHSGNPFFLKFVHYLRPSYDPASRYVLNERYLLAEEARAYNEDLKRLEGRKNLTYLMDGWEDIQRRSIYGTMLAEVGEYPVVLGLEELTGIRATADNLISLSERAMIKKEITIENVIAVCTDNPTTMQAFRRKWAILHPWIIVCTFICHLSCFIARLTFIELFKMLACFMHGINTILGKIVSFPPIKEAISKNSRIVTFFNSSHYWGGQLEMCAQDKGVTRGLKTNTESHFYSLILQALSVKEHKSALMELCGRDGAQRSIGGLTPVNRDVLATVFDLQHWQLTDQLIRICKPIVDIIGDIESRDASLADCMLQLIWAHREVTRAVPIEGDNLAFTSHANRVLTTQFHLMNTDIHWLALFLHPLCRKLAISSAIHSRTLEDAYLIALKIVKNWNWSKVLAGKLAKDLKAYYLGQDPFSGGKADGKDWWESLVCTVTDHPLKAFAVKLFSIVPHAAEVEHFFSNLGGIQSVRRSRLTVAHMQTFGMLRNHYTRQLSEDAEKQGKSTRRKHAHMHTLETPGINAARAKNLTDTFTYTPLATEYSNANIEGPEAITMDEFDAEFDRLEQEPAEPAEAGDNLNKNIEIGEVYDLSTLDGIRNGQAAPTSVENELGVLPQTLVGVESWDASSLLRSLGI